MTLGTAARYLNSWANFGQIRKLNLERQTLEEIVDQVWDFADGFFRPFQIKSELLDALREVRQLLGLLRV